jgi:hypothetical protein
MVDSEYPTSLSKVEAAVSGKLPVPGHYVLALPLSRTLAMEPAELERLQETLVGWMLATAPGLAEPTPRIGTTSSRRAAGSYIPFDVTLFRTGKGPEGRLSIIDHGL